MIFLLLLLGCTRPDQGESDPGTTKDDSAGDSPGDDSGPLPTMRVTASVGPNAATFSVTLSTPLAVEGRCEMGSDPEEIHRFSAEALPSDGDSTHDITVYGLLAEESYHCTLSAGPLSDEQDLVTTELPDGVPDDLLLEVDDGGSSYTLFNHSYGNHDTAEGRLVIVDAAGRVRWFWGYAPVTVDVDATLTPSGAILLGGGYGLSPTLVDLSGTILSEASGPGSGGSWHHHVGLAPSGHYYALSTEDNSGSDGFVFTGFNVEERDPDDDAVKWTWRSQTAVDAGTLSAGGRSDPFHANAIIAENDDDPSGIWVSLRNLNALIRIEKATGEVTWTMSPTSDDFTLVDESGDSAPEEQWFYGQHAPELVGTSLYLFDNGTARPGGDSTRVVAYTLDLAARTLKQDWEWTEEEWYESLWGDVDLLPNGHVFATTGHCNTCDKGGLTPSSWMEIDPVAGVTWRLVAPDLDHATYRAERLDGCGIFGNAKYCPGLLE